MDENFFKQETTRVVNSSFIKDHVGMERAIELMKDAFTILSARSAYIPPRVVMTTPDDKLSVFFKPAFVSRYNRMCIKVLTQILENNHPEIPTIKGLVLLIDMEYGRLLAICDGQYLTALRTGAASGIATSYLANPGASTVAVFGCGAQGMTQLDAMFSVRPISKVLLFDSCGTRAADLAKAAGLNGRAEFLLNPALEALRDADIICTATPSNQPLFELKHLKPGVHINAVGSYRPDMQEIDPEIIANSLVYLDDGPACLEGSGDITIPLAAGIIRKEDIRGELGEMISGSIGGRRSPDQITLFKSVGNAIQDFMVANEAYEKSVLLENAPAINLSE
jgi:ornithine cyclodeaminase/alanine dehydrogenase